MHWEKKMVLYKSNKIKYIFSSYIKSLVDFSFPSYHIFQKFEVRIWKSSWRETGIVLSNNVPSSPPYCFLKFELTIFWPATEKNVAFKKNWEFGRGLKILYKNKIYVLLHFTMPFFPTYYVFKFELLIFRPTLIYMMVNFVLMNFDSS